MVEQNELGAIRDFFGFKNMSITQLAAIAKYQGTTDYKYVLGYKIKEKEFFKARIARFKWSKYFLNKREAAIAVDKKLIEKGKEPVNILKKCLK